MKKILIFFFVFCIPFCMAQEDINDETDDTEFQDIKEENVFLPEKFILRHSLSPKHEQQKTKIWVNKALNKNKKEFQKTIDAELKLLQGEKEILDYK